MKKYRHLFIIILLICASARLNAQSLYELKGLKEAGLISGGSGLALVGLYFDHKIQPLTEDEINRLSKDDVNRFDRSAISNWSPKISTLSDIMQISALILPATLLLSSRIRDDAAELGLIYGESVLLSTGLAAIFKSTVKRTRPYVYNPEVPLAEKQTRFARRSFYSGHATTVFTAAVFFSRIYNNYFPNSDYKPVLLGAVLTEAAIVGYLRFKAGKHFPTDVITGAITGSLIGFIIPEIHKKEKQNNDPFRPDSSFKIGFVFAL